MGKSPQTPSALLVGAVGLLIGLVVGVPGLVSAAPPGSAVVANQGTPGSSAWPVNASQSGTWNVGVSNLPSLPSGTNTIGNVGITAGQTVGLAPGTSIKVSGQTDDVSSTNGALHIVTPLTSWKAFQDLDVTAYKTVKLFIFGQPTNPGNCPGVTVNVNAFSGGSTWIVDAFSLLDNQDTVKSYDLPGEALSLFFFNNSSSDNVSILYSLIGRTE